MLFVEGNHFCPSCEKSGNCQLQATAYEMGMEGPHFEEFYPDRPVDASHPDILLDFNRCILCELCVRASRDVDGKNVFAIGGHGIDTRLLVNSASGELADTPMALDDRATQVCPVGVILPKRRGFAVPIGAAQLRHRAGLRTDRPSRADGQATMNNDPQDIRHAPRKLRLATVSLAGCFGCHMSFLDIDERLFELIEHVEFDRSPLTDIKHCRPLRHRPDRRRPVQRRERAWCCASSAPTARRWWRWAPARSTAACRRSATTWTWACMLTEVYRTPRPA